MNRGGGEEELPGGDERDTEITLGTGMLLAIGGGLILLCSICFGFGYSVGHHGASETTAGVMTSGNTQTSVPAGGSQSKPMAAGQPPAQQPTKVAVDVPADSAPASVPVAEDSAASSQLPVSPVAQAQVRPALATQTSVAQPGVGARLQVQPALTHVQGIMVQVAAVSRTDDAEVLVNALRKRGYKVTVRREVSDSLIHVQTGPFANRTDANAMRQKLLSDGYNAIVQE
jgi:cell division septation protein DedD